MAKDLIFLMDAVRKGRFIKTNIKNGVVNIENKTFFADGSDPILVESKFGFVPFYIMKWDMLTPSSNLNPMKLEKIYPEFSKKSSDLTPEMVRKMINMKILGNMIKTKTPTPHILFILISVLAGALIIYALIFFKIVPIPIR